MTFLKDLKDEKNWSEALYLLAFSCYVIFFYLQSTTFTMNVPGVLYSIVRGVLLFTALTRIVLFRNEIKAPVAVALAAFTGLGIFYFVSRGDFMVLDAALITAGALNVSFKRIGVLYVFISTFISLLALVCSQTGIIPDYTFSTNYGEEERIRHSLGIIYPTDCFAHIFYLVTTYFLIRWKRITYPEIIGAGVLFGVVYYFTSARADMIGAALILVLVLILKLTGFKKITLPDKLKKVFSIAFMPLCAAVILVVTSLYDPLNAYLNRLDAMMSYRLSLGKTGLELYGYKLLGATNFAENGNANGGVRNYSYIFYDSAYIKYLFKYGIVMLLVLFLVYALIGLRLNASKMFYAMVFIGVITLSFIIEHHMLELSYNITLLVLTADISTILQSSPYINKNKRNGIIT